MAENCTPEEISDVPLVDPSNIVEGFVKHQRFRRFMSLVLIGTPSLRGLLQILEQKDETQWRELKGQLIARSSNVTLVGSLATAGSISLVASKSPSPIANWDYPFPYICLLAGGLSSALCVVSGLGLAMFLNAVQPQTVKEIHTSTFRLIVVSLLLAMPFFWLFLGIFAPIIGMAGAVWLGNNAFAKSRLTQLTGSKLWI
ncbi:hypothetical protein EDC04DRAFT_1241220 [Pisolithus marmoratus]|nr:hypothetical protein EDC04DRAFT_1241220 [Pisolithus marmoratus]